jgi:hypothetical protein
MYPGLTNPKGKNEGNPGALVPRRYPCRVSADQYRTGPERSYTAQQVPPRSFVVSGLGPWDRERGVPSVSVTINRWVRVFSMTDATKQGTIQPGSKVIDVAAF